MIQLPLKGFAKGGAETNNASRYSEMYKELIN
jgi:hypothetical protein